MVIPPGILLLDANALWRLEESDIRQRVLRSARAADLLYRPTAVNLFEIVRTTNEKRRLRLLSIMAELADGAMVLPLPLEFLRRVGEMISRGNHTFMHQPSDHEWMLYEPERITAQVAEAAGRMLDEQQAIFDDRHNKARKHVRDLLNEKGIKVPWGSTVAFLDEQWTTRSHLDTYVEKHWEQLGLPGAAPIDAVIQNEAWRLHFEGLGATVYERAVVNQAPQPAHLSDIDQLVYMAGSPKRILVTDDGGLRRVANDVLHRRYCGSRVITVAELIEGS